MATHPRSLPARPRPAGRTTSLTALAAAPYWLLLVGIYTTYGFLWYYSAKEKLIDQDAQMPAGLAKAFNGSFLDSFPGLDTAWLLLGVLEAAAFVLFAASLVAGEFLPARRKPLLMVAIAFSVATFAAMAFAQNMIGAVDSVASLFTYMAGSVVILAVVAFLTPARVKDWLTDRGTVDR